jgi:ubiquinone/menaquinone biosynthesis C-methylase UbiE
VRSSRSASAAARTWSGDTGHSSARGADSRSDAAKARRATAGPAARNLARVSERYTETAIHFDVERLPSLLARAFPPGPLALADIGCGDGPLFAALAREGIIEAEKPVYAVDLERARLDRVARRFAWIQTVVASADSVPEVADGALDAVISTMVMEHARDEHPYLAEIKRVLRPGGRAYLTTVFKKPWAWYFRTRDGESVLDTSHLHEYTDLDAFRSLVESAGLRVATIQQCLLWFPLVDRQARRTPPPSARAPCASCADSRLLRARGRRRAVR